MLSDADSLDSIAKTDQISRTWYESQSGLYDFDAPDGGSEGNQFTRMIWKGSCEIGCGFAGKFAVCQYSPDGNKPGEFSENVMALL